MKKVFLLLLPLFVLAACGSKLSPEDAEQIVISGEWENLPLRLQLFKRLDVEDISIDSLVLTVQDEPMRGMLYTTWKSTSENWRTGKKTTQEERIIISVDSIMQSPTQPGYVQWQTDWKQAALSFLWTRE